MDPLIYPPIETKWLFPLKTAVFNGRKCPVPANADDVLGRYYGNWCDLPDIKNRCSHYGNVSIW
jgi:phosphorylcholine metabolism protein LicD